MFQGVSRIQYVPNVKENGMILETNAWALINFENKHYEGIILYVSVITTGLSIKTGDGSHQSSPSFLNYGNSKYNFSLTLDYLSTERKRNSNIGINFCKLNPFTTSGSSKYTNKVSSQIREKKSFKTIS